MSVRGGRIRLQVADRGAVYPVTVDPWIQEAILSAPDGAAGDYFGGSVSVNGSTAVIGAPPHSGGGAVYVFTQSGGAWTLQQELAHPRRVIRSPILERRYPYL